MLVLRPDDTGLGPRAWLVAAPAILVWPAAAAQPSAVVLARCGVFVARLSGAPHRIRYLLATGDYAAEWRHGRVLLARRASSI